jgi:[ribosomal protein S5]-alanine N-acetyltransferase
MGNRSAPEGEIGLKTGRLQLRPWHVSEAVFLHELWTERDPRVPPHRRIDAEGRPTVADLEDRLRCRSYDNALGLLVAERKSSGDVIGYCGLTENIKVPEGEPELAFEFLRRTWGQGYATEASWAVLGWAQASGYRRLWATVSDWNAASRRVLAKLGFIETDHVEPSEGHGDVLFVTKQL